MKQTVSTQLENKVLHYLRMTDVETAAIFQNHATDTHGALQVHHTF